MYASGEGPSLKARVATEEAVSQNPLLAESPNNPDTLLVESPDSPDTLLAESPDSPDPLLAEPPDSTDRRSGEMPGPGDDPPLETEGLCPTEPADDRENRDADNNNVDSSTCGCLTNLFKKDFWLKPQPPEIGKCFWIFYVFSIVFLVVGVGLNIGNLVEYASGNHWYYFGIMLSSMLVPQCLINPLSYWWTNNDYAERDQIMSCHAKVFHWVAGFLFLTWDTGRYAWRISHHNEKEHYHDAFLRQADLAHIRLVNTCIASGPQLVLKLYRLINEEWGGSSGSTVFFSFLTAGSMAMSIMTISLNSRRIRPDKK